MEGSIQMGESIVYRERQQEVIQYEQFVKNELERTKKRYEDMFNDRINKWSGEVSQSIKFIVEASSSNQILPKLELVYTTLVNQETQVIKSIENVGAVLMEGSYVFDKKHITLKQPQCIQAPERNDPFKGTITYENNTAPNKFGRSTSNKNRSLSFGNARRRLSKTNCFAEAKKVEVNKTYLQTTNHNLFKTVNNDRIKKGKKKQQNGFKYLQKCLNSTSPSNFVLNHMVRTENQQDYSKIKSPIKPRSRREKTVQEESQIKISINGKEEKQFKRSKLLSHQRKDSGTYQKMMDNFQHKISNKIDQLMNKYTQIQQRLQRSESIKKIEREKLERKNDSKQNKQRNIENISQNVSQVKDVVQEVKIIERQPFKPKQVSQITRQTKNTLQVTKKSVTGKDSIKSIAPKNKIVRNKIEQNIVQSDVEVYNLKKQTKIKNEQKQKIQKQLINNYGDKQISKFQRDQQYIQKLILDFHQNTSKFILPISKQLLYVLKSKYISFSSDHFLPLNQNIESIEVESIKDEKKDMKQHLEKMKKLLKLNCNAQKKEKILVYFNSFLRGYLSFGPENSIISKDRSKDTNTEQLISEAFSLLNG